MFITDLKKDFFDQVVTNRVLVLVNCDVDGVCATKILQYLFKYDHVLYSLIPVSGKKEFYNAFKNNIEGVNEVLYKKYLAMFEFVGECFQCGFLPAVPYQLGGAQTVPDGRVDLRLPG